MSIIYNDAKTQMRELFNNGWQATIAIVGEVPEIRWDSKEEKKVPKGNYWCRFSITNVEEEQTTLANSVSGPGKRRYTLDGFVMVELYCKKSALNSFIRGEQLAKVARDIFRGKQTQGGIWFKNVRINERQAEEDYYGFNVIAEYEYDELG